MICSLYLKCKVNFTAVPQKIEMFLFSSVSPPPPMTTSIDNMNSIIHPWHRSTAMEAALSDRTAEANAELLAALAKVRV